VGTLYNVLNKYEKILQKYKSLSIIRQTLILQRLKACAKNTISTKTCHFFMMTK